ncbi:ABC transporter substrate-binding protein, partial [Fusobacterium periodonticum]
FKCINDQSTRALSLKSGEIGVAYNLKIENKADFEGQDDINIQELKSLRSTYAFMNQHGALGDLSLRQALLRALDKKTYTEKLLGGAATPGKAPIPPTLDFGFDKLVDENAFNPESAKEILAKAGYKDVDGDGFVEKPDGSKLELNFVIYTSREELKVYAQAAQANLKDVGINVNLKTVSYETLLDMRDSGNFDLLIWNVLAANTGDPEKYLYENWDSSSASNQAGYKNAKVDELLDKLNAEFDPEKRKDLAIEIQQLIMNDAATVFFGYETTFLYSNKKVQNLKMFPMDYYWLTKDVTVSE